MQTGRKRAVCGIESREPDLEWQWSGNKRGEGFHGRDAGELQRSDLSSQQRRDAGELQAHDESRKPKAVVAGLGRRTRAEEFPGEELARVLGHWVVAAGLGERIGAGYVPEMETPMFTSDSRMLCACLWDLVTGLEGGRCAGGGAMAGDEKHDLRKGAVSVDGLFCCTISSDQSVKIYDVVNYDMMVMLRLPFVPGAIEWVYKQGDVKAKLAISDCHSHFVHVYDAHAGYEPILSREIHMAPLKVMRYNHTYDIVISADVKGVLEYWSPTTLKFPEEG
ncbi:hypothetical protein KSP40_PGU012409 [Platanthera guangdongensis]|uniref:Uncharacterized protein n=1 Tax=Platanthera guangdongensis TaxID=2320717 RepID=A0ABR2M9Q9_9ASPA